MKTIVMGLIGLMWVELFAHTDINTRFYFDSDKDTLNTQQRSQLQEFIQTALNGKKYREIYVVGYTDADGSNGYNMDLSLRRARYVSEMLVEKGIPESMIDKQYKGENLPAATNKTEEGKSLNRRVEVILRTFDIQKAADILYEIKGNPEKIVTIDNTKEVTVTGDKGIRVIFPPNCFITADNKPIDPKNITIELEEVRTVTDALFSGVLSQADNSLPLESGGMFRIKASLNGTELKMKPNMQYTVQLNNEELKKGMNIFVPAANTSGILSWSDTKDPFKNDSVFKGVRPSIKLDKDIISNWKLEPKYAGLLDGFTFKLPDAPSAFHLPKRPKDVAEPNKDTYVYKEPWMKRLFMTKTAEEKKRLEMYEKMHDIYENQHAKYLTKLDKYLKDSAAVADQIQAYQTALVQYEKDMTEIAKSLNDYTEALRENALLRSFDNMKSMLIYKSQNNLLHTKDLYGLIDQYLWKISAYSNFNSFYLGRLQDYKKKFYEACDQNLHHQVYTQPKRIYFGCDNNYAYNFIDPLREDKTVEAHFDKAIEDYMKAEVASGIFDPENFSLYYQANLSKFGWVNCDRFYNTPPADMITVQVPDYNIQDKNVIAVIKDINSTLRLNKNNKGMLQVSLPKNKDVVILAIGLDKNYSPVIAQQTIKTEKNMSVPLQFKQVKLSEIKQAINNI